MKYKDSIYGAYEISGVLEEIINTDIFQRLKRIHQSGAYFLVNPKANRTRFEHSIGVMLLIRKLGGSLEEQVAGLIHDISHTAFSHLIDYVLDNSDEDYHEEIFPEVIQNHEIQFVLGKYGLSSSQFLDHSAYKILESPFPNLSADRLDYSLRDLYHFEEISKSEIGWFLNGLSFDGKKLVLDDIDKGVWIQEKYQLLINKYFTAKENIDVNLKFKMILKEMMHREILSIKDFEKDDFYLIQLLEREYDMPISALLSQERFDDLSSENISIKKRQIDPWIVERSEAIRLSEMIKK
ncbi:HD domain-containing protein [Sediminitomix flava]|uniref:HD/PDEase domain-containing protein n=1 Tax=Sediminitomix flava TaxID=379075 RepID=A0A315ZII4_SEDFL|nr:HD domain-containing protein [Sediminitomix flava]PWJ45023.1 hypothetical protein BC781_1011421 [Sediminitomix flava]